eukprot:scaffold173783_cov17-Tisochrysis_lutea.AAC.2
MSATGQPLVARCRTQAAGKTPAALCSRAAYWALAKVIYLLPCFTPFVTHFIQALMCAAAGVAPFRAMLEERQAQAQATSTSGTAGCTQGAPNNSASPAPCTLFFGCRSRAADFYYGQQWHELQDQGVLLPPPDGLVVAFSRDQPSKVCLIERVRTPCFPTASRRLSMQPCDQGSTMEMALVLWLAYMLVPCLIEPACLRMFPFPFFILGQPSCSCTPHLACTVCILCKHVYVTHKLREHAACVWSLISKNGASVFVSGSAQQMPANVVSALEDVAQEQGGMGKEEASKFVRQLELTGRFC